jgi:hypothetical protein
MSHRRAKKIRKALFKQGISIAADPYMTDGRTIYSSNRRRAYQRQKRALALVVWLMLICGVANAETRINVVTGRAETVPDGSDSWTTQLNPVTGEASIQPADAIVEPNVVTGEAEWDSGHNE